MARSKGDQVLDEILRKVSDEDEETFELDDGALPYLYRVIYSLSPKWHGFCLQLDVPDLDQIKKNGTGADDCLVIALQNWLKEGTATWRNLIRAIFLPVGGGNQVLAKKIASSFKEIRCFKPIEQAQSASKAVIWDQSSETTVQNVVKEIQAVLGKSVTARWYQMGTVLGAPVGDLEGIRVDQNASLIEKQCMMLEAWLSSIESSDDSNKTWQWLVDSIGHPAGGKHPKMASKMAELHQAEIVSFDEPPVTARQNPAGPKSVVSEKVQRSMRPNMVKLLSFPTSEGYKNLAEQIGGKYTVFGTIILNDESHAIMDGLEITHNSRAEAITEAVFTKWVNSEKTPVTWDNLLSTLRRSGLERLATLVESGLI